MNRFEKCWCGDTFGKHDDNGVCRVKDCDCIEFDPVNESKLDEVITVYGATA
jgi:hypothetical protein